MNNLSSLYIEYFAVVYHSLLFLKIFCSCIFSHCLSRENWKIFMKNDNCRSTHTNKLYCFGVGGALVYMYLLVLCVFFIVLWAEQQFCCCFGKFACFLLLVRLGNISKYFKKLWTNNCTTTAVRGSQGVRGVRTHKLIRKGPPRWSYTI